eukprot:748537-Hanusia_phi.AAC.3
MSFTKREWSLRCRQTPIDVCDQVISGGEDGTVRMWNIDDGRCSMCLEGESAKFNNVQSCRIACDQGPSLAVYASDTIGKIWMWDYRTGLTHTEFYRWISSVLFPSRRSHPNCTGT